MGRRCVFCGDRADSKEDAVPHWLLQQHARLYGTGDVAHRWGALDDPELVRRGTWDGLAMQVRSVCRGCNSGWMSNLENETIPILGPMLSGLATQLYELQQRTLAFWALKTAAVLQEANRRLGLPMPRPHIEALYQGRDVHPRQLPTQTVVWVAKHLGPSVGLAYLTPYSTSAEGRFAPRAINDEHRYWIGLRVGTVAFHILGHTLQPTSVQHWVNEDSLLQIWLSQAPVLAWPPHRGLNDEEFESLARTSLPQATVRRGGVWVRDAGVGISGQVR